MVEAGPFVPPIHNLLHPLEGLGYQFWSGVGSDFGELTLITGLAIGFWRTRKHLECHVEAPKNCHRIGRPVPGTGHRACRLHHPHAEEKGTGITAQSILECHEASERRVGGPVSPPPHGPSSGDKED